MGYVWRFVLHVKWLWWGHSGDRHSKWRNWWPFHSMLLIGIQIKQNTIYLTEFVWHAQHPVRSPPPYIAMKRDAEGVDESAFELKCFKCLDTLTRRLNLYQQVRFRQQANRKRWTLIARVQIAAMTSREPLNTRLSGRDGLYSQMAVVVSTTAIFVMWSITSTFARLTTWARHL